MLRHEQRRAALVHRKLHRPDLVPRFSPTAPGFGGQEEPTDVGRNPVIIIPTQTFNPIIEPSETSIIIVAPAPSSSRVVNPTISSPLPVTPSSSSSPVPVAPLSASSSSSRVLITSSTSTSATPVTTPVTTPAATPVISPTSSSHVVVTSSQPTSASFGAAAAASTSPSASDTPQASGSSNVGGIVGGVAAGVVGLLVICVIVAFFLRRRRASRESFHPHSFRRSAVILDEPPTHADNVERGFNPPPSMAERHGNNAHMSFGTQYGVPGAHVPNAAYGYGATQQYQQDYAQQYPQQYSQQYQQQYQQSHDPVTPNSSNPLMYSQAPYSPVAPSLQSSTVAGYDSMYQNDNSNILSAPFLTRTVTNETGTDRTLSRKTSANTLVTRNSTQLLHRMQSDNVQYATYPDLSNDSARHSVPLPSSDYVDLSRTSVTPFPAGQYQPPSADYVDLSRASVTPFQAAQYVEISKKLDSAPPNGLDTPAVDAYVQSRQPSNGADEHESVHRDDASPFADPEHGRSSTDSQDEVQELDFPVPPSPVLTTSSRYKVDAPPTPPPTLPEIRVQSRSSFGSYEFPMSVGQPAEYLASTTSFPSTPSPLSSSFIIRSPPAAKTEFSASPQSATGAVHGKPIQEESHEKKRPETVYDPEDAYGGI